MFCLQCAKPLFKKNLCEFCWLALRETQFKTIREVESFPVYTFWSWPMDHPLKALWLQNLKGVEDYTAWAAIIEILIGPYSPQGTPWDADTLWVPLPSHRANNHAFGIAKALMRANGGTLWDGLKLIVDKDGGNVSEQKSKSRLQRANRKVIALGKAPCSSFSTVCFVDDIITTGSTFRGAMEALGYPENGLGLALMDRPLSR